MTLTSFGVRLHPTPLHKVTDTQWKSAKEVLRDIGIAAVFWLVALLVLGVTATALHFRGSRETVGFMAPEGAAQIIVWILLSATAGFCEETIFRGYLQKQFIAWSGNATLGVVFSAAIFGACQIYHGTKAAVLRTLFRLLFGILAQ